MNNINEQTIPALIPQPSGLKMGSTSDNKCSGELDGFNTTLSSCSATIWIIVDIPFARAHEMSHYRDLEQLENSLRQLVMDSGCECHDCSSARKAWIRAQMNFAIEQYNVAILTRDCNDNDGGNFSGPYCSALIVAQARLIYRRNSLQDAMRRVADTCN